MTERAISSVQNQRIKDAVKLRDRHGREKQRRVLIDGARELLRAIAAGATIHELFACDQLCTSDDSRKVLAAARERSVRLTPVTPAVFAKLAFGDRAEGVIGTADIELPPLDSIELPPRALVAVVESLEKPGNLGAVLRSADGASVAAVVVTGGGTDVFNPATIRASLGTVFTQTVCTASSGEAIGWLRRLGIKIFAARVDGALRYDRVDLTGPVAIVLGSEAAGLSAEWMADDVGSIALPMLGVADSLNVSAAAAVLFYEARRQRDARA